MLQVPHIFFICNLVFTVTEINTDFCYVTVIPVGNFFLFLFFKATRNCSNAKKDLRVIVKLYMTEYSVG